MYPFLLRQQNVVQESAGANAQVHCAIALAVEEHVIAGVHREKQTVVMNFQVDFFCGLRHEN